MNKQELKEKKFEWNISIFLSAFTLAYFIISLSMLGLERQIPEVIGFITTVLGMTLVLNLYYVVLMRLNIKDKEKFLLGEETK